MRSRTVAVLAGLVLSAGLLGVLAVAAASVPATPTNTTAVAISSSQIQFSWTENSTQTSFYITDGTTGVSVGATVRNYTWGGLAPSTYKCFTITAKNASGQSPWAPWACATSLSGITQPLAITYFRQYQGWGSSNCDCGPTAVAMSIYYLDHGYPTGISSVSQLVGDVRTHTGTSTSSCTDTNATQLEQAVRAYSGRSATEIDGTGDTGAAEVQRMQNATGAGDPVVAYVDGYYLGHSYDGHWVVVRGFSTDGQTVYINDPDDQSGSWGGQYSVSRATFQNAVYYAPVGAYGIIVY